MLNTLLRITNLNAFIKAKQVLSKVNFSVNPGQVLAIIGPMGAGKSTLLRCLNRLFEEWPDTRVEGKVEFLGKDVYDKSVDVLKLRRKIGMIFSEPTAFMHMSIFENVAVGLRLSGATSGAEIGEAVEKALGKVMLWESLKDQLHNSPGKLGPGDLQRLCIARALVLKPKVLLLDEPTSVLGLNAGTRLEQMLRELREKTTIVFATSSRKQAARISDQTAFMLDGELIEIGKTSDLFMNPQDARTEDYLTGRFG